MTTAQEFEYDFEFVNPPETEIPTVTSDVDKEFAEIAQETARARKYRKKVANALGNIWRPLLGSPDTISDAAAILQYGPDFARAAGKLADEDEKARRVCDFILEGADNAYLMLAATAIPLFIQLVRNHEKSFEPEVRGWRIPFTKRQLKFKIGLKLGRLRNLSHDPNELTYHVLANPSIMAALQKQGLRIAWNESSAGANGSRKRS